MATSSITTNIKIVDSRKAVVLANALEEADKNRSQKVATVKFSSKTKKAYDSFIKSTVK